MDKQRSAHASTTFSGIINVLQTVHQNCGTGTRGLMRGMATLPQVNQEPLVVRQSWKTPGELEVSKSMKCDIFPSVRVSNPVFTETEKPGNRSFSKPKNRFLAACKPGFSVLNFDLQMSNYATILAQTSCNVHDSMFLFVYIYHGDWRPALQGPHSTGSSSSN